MSTSVALPFASEHDPAADLGSLLEFLRSQDTGCFLYRGQTRFWPGPLFPSAHRRFQRTGAVYTRKSKEYADALRKVGRRFVGLVPVNFFHESLALYYPSSVSASVYEMTLLQRLSNDQYLARTLIDGPDAFELMLTDFDLMMFRDRFACWKEIIDHDHRVQIRDMVFMRPFGYLLGQALAQQYGFSSEMLDVTSDPHIAAFFATHESPQFFAPVREGIGVIYRFLRPEASSLPLDLGKYNFYSCPGVLEFKELLSRFGVTEEHENLRSEVENFLVSSIREKKKWRQWDALRLSPGIIAATRIARQSAGFLAPDAIYVEHERKGARLNKACILMAIEDCATRKGTTVFYFRHRGDASACSPITREYLWPNEEDAFFEMVGNALLMSVVLDSGQILPSRIDLLDPGYHM